MDIDPNVAGLDKQKSRSESKTRVDIRMVRRRQKAAIARKIANERVRILWQIALEKGKTNSEYARELVAVARRIARKVRRRLPLYIARRICRQCGRVLFPGINCRVRMRNNRQTHLTVTCLSCGTIRRFPIKREKRD